MEVEYRDSFEDQRRRYGFCFTCEHCAHFDDEREVCLHGFPNRMHRLDRYLPAAAPRAILFCKDFDLA